mmetsp:Transcript_27895/g.70206  ORF Transcript_27895/g.70206 Transcript_27895/m.70206 type:complete len:254 (+) Transcript_27895:318-1079(+)|eukprot:CAMPEP_0179986174 /NCGR_PEP_ID=MMETSP0984-20121128/2089_1 /TAXON_ID=483367 /ORGANISM="non described non described, Strain CCMP 2436" /LENGTH=253 /DNA_ID=CAMNT_0021904937 /DNA_START=246 /DNA_END=1007 /DNA_ORIENTATION=+
MYRALICTVIAAGLLGIAILGATREFPQMRERRDVTKPWGPWLDSLVPRCGRFPSDEEGIAFATLRGVDGPAAMVCEAGLLHEIASKGAAKNRTACRDWCLRSHPRGGCCAFAEGAREAYCGWSDGRATSVPASSTAPLPHVDLATAVAFDICTSAGREQDGPIAHEEHHCAEEPDMCYVGPHGCAQLCLTKGLRELSRRYGVRRCVCCGDQLNFCTHKFSRSRSGVAYNLYTREPHSNRGDRPFGVVQVPLI